MSQIREVLKNKNKVEKAQKERRKQNMAELRSTSAFRAALHDELKKISIILDDDDVDYIIVEVPNDQISRFTGAIFKEVNDFEITQVDGEPNKFIIRDKIISF